MINGTKSLISKPIFLLSILVLSIQAYSQTGTGCDSLYIDSITFNPLNVNELIVNVTNANANEKFLYPTFILLDSQNDTIAKEVIAAHDSITGTQQHFLSIQKAFGIPMVFYIHLYTDSLNTFNCIMLEVMADTIKMRCDSISIDSIYYDSINGEIFMSMTNRNVPTIFFSYPSFNMFNSNDDTIAVSPVFHFGMGMGYSQHTFTVKSPIQFPLSGYIEFYSGFGAQLECIFSFTLNSNGQLIGIKEPQRLMHEVEIFPNPTQDLFHLKVNNHASLQYEIYDLLGKRIERGNIENPSISISSKNWKKGMYSIRVMDINGQYTQQKLLVQ